MSAANHTFTLAGTLLFPQVYVPKAVSAGGKQVYSASLLISDEDVRNAMVVVQAAADAGPPKGQPWGTVDLATIALPFMNGDAEKVKADNKQQDGSFYVGKYVARARSQFPPEVIDRQGGAILPVEGQKHHPIVYSGAHAAMEVRFEAYDAVGNGQRGVKAYLNTLMIIAHGTKIAQRNPLDAFRGVLGTTTAHDPGGAGLPV